MAQGVVGHKRTGHHDPSHVAFRLPGTRPRASTGIGRARICILGSVAHPFNHCRWKARQTAVYLMHAEAVPRVATQIVRVWRLVGLPRGACGDNASKSDVLDLHTVPRERGIRCGQQEGQVRGRRCCEICSIVLIQEVTELCARRHSVDLQPPCRFLPARNCRKRCTACTTGLTRGAQTNVRPSIWIPLTLSPTQRTGKDGVGRIGAKARDRRSHSVRTSDNRGVAEKRTERWSSHFERDQVDCRRVYLTRDGQRCGRRETRVTLRCAGCWRREGPLRCGVGGLIARKDARESAGVG
mmetsp:Transcript_44721/g.118645  ORF Transcript_44721/g.118645 Transcript_44721/m.118645 type:complete len:297 (-) Transcript_44721:357-1247(-)